MTDPQRRPFAGGIPLRYLLVFWLFLLSAVAFLDRTNISIAGVEIGREFKIDNTRLGWIFSAFLIGYAAFQVPGGVLVRRYGPRLVLSIGVVWWGVFTVLTSLVPPGMAGAVSVLILVRLALGAGEATMYPATNQFVERWFPVEERGKANGLIFGGVGMGSGLTPPLVTAIVLRFGWRASFWMSAGLGLVVGAVWFLAARDTPEEHLRVSSAELGIIRRGRRSADPAPGKKSPTPWSKILLNKDILAITASYFSFCYVAWIFFGWFYIYLAQTRGLDLKASAMFSMLPFLAMTCGSLGGGVVSDWIARHVGHRWGRCGLSTLSLASTAVLLVLGSRAPQARTASLLLAAAAGALYVSQSCFWAVSADIAGEYSGIVSGLMNAGGQIGGALTASLTPLISAHFGWEAAFLTAAILSGLSAVAWLVVDPKRSLAPAPAAMPAAVS